MEDMPGMPGKPGGMPKGPGPGNKGARNMAVQKPKDMKKTLKRLFSYIAGDKWKLIVVCFCVVAGTVSSLAGSYMLRPIINGLTSPEGSEATLLKGLVP